MKHETETKKLKPIIKWTGGKYEEYARFSKYIPGFKRYIEPFFGGGGVFFALQPQQPSLLNDKSNDLVLFYSLLQSPALKNELLLYADGWDAAGEFSIKLIHQLRTPFYDYIKGSIDRDEIKNIIIKNTQTLCSKGFHPLFNDEFIINKNEFIAKLQASLIDKCKRIKDICLKEKKVFNERELSEHIETGVKSGLYLHLRSLMNKHSLGQLTLSKEKAAANWYFVREFCYASMFRFNAKNEFNIPYGGIAYNKKNFRLKAEKVTSPQVKNIFKRSVFSNLDFEIFLKRSRIKNTDFIFLDPPYDSDFSEYDQNAFTKDDQLRLRNTLVFLPAKWMLIIKETPFIKELYNIPSCRIIEFDKTYTYNVRGRNNRDTKHLIILNYEP